MTQQTPMGEPWPYPNTVWVDPEEIKSNVRVYTGESSTISINIPEQPKHVRARLITELQNIVQLLKEANTRDTLSLLHEGQLNDRMYTLITDIFINIAEEKANATS